MFASFVYSACAFFTACFHIQLWALRFRYEGLLNTEL